MTQRLLIVGTDTGVGKTFVSALLCRALRASGEPVTAVKPAASGCEIFDGRLVSDDTRLLAEATGERDFSRVTRWNFAEPLAPAQSARRAGTPFTLADVAAFVEEVRPASGWQVIEGAGGLLSPLAEDGDAADLARMLNLPVILVAACRLGAIHQVRIVAEYARFSGLDLRCVLVNRLRPPGDLAEDTLADELRRWVDRPVAEVAFATSDLPEAALRVMMAR